MLSLSTTLKHSQHKELQKKPSHELSRCEPLMRPKLHVQLFHLKLTFALCAHNLGTQYQEAYDRDGKFMIEGGGVGGSHIF